MNIDNLIKTIFWDTENNKLSNTYKRYIQIKHRYPNITQYLNNRYNDSTSLQETVTRIVYNIEIRPTCPICGGPVDFIGKPNSKGIFKKHCSHTCSSKNKETTLKANATSLLRHGSKNCPEKSKQTKKERYGDENYNNRKQAIITNHKKYGGAAPICDNVIKESIKEKWKNKSSNEINNIVLKRKQTCLKLYNDENYRNGQQIKESWLKKDNLELKEIQLQIKQTCLKLYNDENYRNTSQIKKTKKYKYGDENYNNTNKRKETNKIIYGVEFATQNKTVISKIINTKQQNKTFNTSQLEEDSYIIIKDKYDDVIRQYKDERYPFACDFYIPSLDLFIEIQGLWTHGKHPYNENNNDDVELANKWKNSISKFYNNAYETWVIRDVLKRNIAKQNNLNYIELWDIDDVIKFIES